MSNRRNFLKISGLAGFGLLACNQGGGGSSSAGDTTKAKLDNIQTQAVKTRKPVFNMSGYAAPALSTVRVGMVGLGNRGIKAVQRLKQIDGVKITALCDLRPEMVERSKQELNGTIHQPVLFSGAEENWKKLCERDDIDMVYICTHWALHIPVALYAMNHGKHVCVEVRPATSIEECWELVDTSERTRKHCMMLENCCYDFFELLTLNMARQGFFGEVIHCEGGYLHNLLQGNLAKNKYWDLWRLKENAYRNGNLYPTHGLGPVAQIMKINRGDKMDYLSSMSGNDFMIGEKVKELAAKDTAYQPFAGKTFRGNMNTSTIRTALGKTIMLQHDVTSPRPYSRIHLVSGTKATALKFPLPGRISLATQWTSPEDWAKTHEDEWMTDKEFAEVEKKYTPAIVKEIGETAKRVGGHGGMDFLMDWRTIDCLRNGLPMDIDVYDTALWSCIGQLSEWSVANRSNSIDVPDFTGGNWKTNKPVTPA